MISGLTRQRRWQMRMKAAGRCIQCGKEKINKNHCLYHAKKHQKYSARRYRVVKQLKAEARRAAKAALHPEKPIVASVTV